MSGEFEEIAHSGGIVSFKLEVSRDGKRGVTFSWRSSRPVPSVLVGYYVLPPGLVVETLPLGGMGTGFPPPTIPGSLPLLIASDSEGQFGHDCPRCLRYWRSGPFPHFCPYCGVEAEPQSFLSKAQKRFAQHYCEKWSLAANQIEAGTIEINLDQVADATIQGSSKPDFYISDERQQTILDCDSCGAFNDILGRFGFCSDCYTRNDYVVFEREIVAKARGRLKDHNSADGALRDLYSGFETLVKSYLRILSENSPLIPDRRDKISKDNYSPSSAQAAFLEVFGINLYKGVSDDHIALLDQLHSKRHVFEHNGGIVDRRYLEKAGDQSVRIGQRLSVDSSTVFALANTMMKCAENIHSGFHAIFPVRAEPITEFSKKSKG
jgi:hypothetical protein